MNRIRIGNYVAGIRFNRTGHALWGNFMIGKVADTLAVLNSIKGTTEQMYFADYDSKLDSLFEDIVKLRGLCPFEIGHFIIFKSEMKNQETHYFMISPFHYTKNEIRLMLAIADNVDGKFTGVYMRDKVNAIRFVPKVIGNNTSRKISLVTVLLGSTTQPTRKLVYGMMQLIQEYFPTIVNEWDEGLLPTYQDNTTKSDLTLREYETIRW